MIQKLRLPGFLLAQPVLTSSLGASVGVGPGYAGKIMGKLWLRCSTRWRTKMGEGVVLMHCPVWFAMAKSYAGGGTASLHSRWAQGEAEDGYINLRHSLHDNPRNQPLVAFLIYPLLNQPRSPHHGHRRYGPCLAAHFEPFILRTAPAFTQASSPACLCNRELEKPATVTIPERILDTQAQRAAEA